MRKGSHPWVNAESLSPRGWLGIILALSYALRVILAWSGGQQFWPDEVRYGSTQNAAYHLVRGHWRLVADELLGQADHMLFRWIGLPVALVEEAVGRHPALAASYFGLFSVLAIYLIWAVARRAGAGDCEALWAAFLAACSNSLFYYSRHYFPYDSSLCLMLAALWLALGPWSPRNSFLVGVAAAAGFLAYNGYWLLGGVVLVLHTLLGKGGGLRIVARGACAGAGLALALAAVVGIGLAMGYKLIASFLMYAGNVTQGDYHLAYRVIPEYLWHSEGLLFLLWLAAFALGFAYAGRDGRRGRLAWYGGGVVLLAGGLIFFSDIVPKFMVHGRLTRGLVPFLCLGAAVGIERFLGARAGVRRAAGIAIALFAAGCAAVNFRAPLRQVFPDGFYRLVAREIARQSGDGFGFYRMLFAESLWGKRLDLPPPPYPVVLRRSHPLQFRPYQYEGYSAAQRLAINGNDVSMRLLRLPAALGETGSNWDGFPGPVRMKLIFPADCPGTSEPLVTCGRTGVGDFIFVRYLDEGHVAFGVDHWGFGARISAPVTIDYRRPHELLLSAGCLLPPEESGFYRRAPEWAAWRRRLLVIIDGRVVLATAQEFFPESPGGIEFGIDLIGGSTVQPSFSGEVSAFGPAPPEPVKAALSGPEVWGAGGWRP